MNMKATLCLLALKGENSLSDNTNQKIDLIRCDFEMRGKSEGYRLLAGGLRYPGLGTLTPEQNPDLQAIGSGV